MITQNEISKYQTSIFDKQFALAHKAGKIVWYPWVGKQYPNVKNKALVVLESHYINWERNNIEALSLFNFTQRVVAEQIIPQYHWKSNTFNNLGACLSGKKLSCEEAHLLWEKLALCNFIQRPMDNPNARPNEKDFENGWKAFSTIVDILQPNVCIFVGFSAISNLIKLPSDLQLTGLTPYENEKINGTYPRPCFTIKTLNHTMKCVAIKHPGKFFSVDKWRAVLQRQIPEIMKELSL